MKSIAIVLFVSLLAAGCGEYAARGAGQGAATGAASGAVGGLMSALIFGGDPVEAAARGAVWGGATGATAGAIAGSQKDGTIKDQEAQAKEQIGEDAFNGLSALLRCEYENTLQNATRSKQSENPNYSVSGYWLEVLSYTDQGNGNTVDKLLPTVVEKDWETNDPAQAREQLSMLQGELLIIRKEYNLPANCN